MSFMLNRKHLLLVTALILLIAIWFWSSEEESVVEIDSAVVSTDVLEHKSLFEVSVTEELKYFPGAKGYFVRPTAVGDYSGIVMVHENDGLSAEIRETTKSLAKAGYLVLAVDLFGAVAENQEGAQVLTTVFEQEVGIANMRAAADYLRGQGAIKLASLGRGFGGRQAVELATSGEKLNATIVYYGSGISTSTKVLQPITWPVLGIFGEEDKTLPVAAVLDFSNALSEIGVENEIHIYPGVGQGFANPSDVNYAPEATLYAWDKTLDFLDRHLGS